ncbi:hypothetical protein B0H10DRAFT_1711402, partial [Mycena sp. CBHHK59/15]
VHPVLSLPPEITSEIFIHCLPSGFLKPSTRKAPLLFTQICHRWRLIALETPELW